MKASETTLRNLLQGERQYVVPLYQRPYSWERKDLDQLWQDLIGVVDSGEPDLISSARWCSLRVRGTHRPVSRCGWWWMVSSG